MDHAAFATTGTRGADVAGAARPAARRGRRPRSRLGATLLVGLTLSGLVGCGSAGDSSAGAGTSAPPPSSSSPPPPPPVWPLTGTTSDGVQRPALAVKIENSIDARPQTGLDAADQVWEQVVEGGITRYVAVYHSTLPPEIGPVRSLRPMDPEIAAPLRGLLAFSGGFKGYIAEASEAGLQVIGSDGGAAGFHRIGSRRAPHNVYADPAALLASADPAHQAPPPAPFDFASPGERPTAVTAGKPAAALQLTLSPLSHPGWTWSSPDGRWLRAEGGNPAVGADGKQLAATNVVVLRVDVVPTARLDAARNPVPETVLTGTGEALVATSGSAVSATWSKGAAADVLALTGAGGDPVQLAPGTTWIELVPNGTGAVTVG